MTRLRPSPAMVVALIALVLSLTGGAYAAVRVTSRNIADRAVTHRKIATNAVRRRNIGPGGVAHRQLSPSAVGHRNLRRAAVGADNIHDGAITNAKLGKGAVDKDNLSHQLKAEIQGSRGPQGPAGASGANGKNGANPAVEVLQVPAITAGENAQGYVNSGKTGDQGFFFTGVDPTGAHASFEDGQLVLRGSGTDPNAPQGSVGIAKRFSNMPLSHLDALSFTWHVSTPNANQTPTIHITVSGLHSNSNFQSGFANLVYSPGLSPNGVMVSPSVQYQSDTLAGGALWYSTGGTGPGTLSQPRPLSFFIQNNPDAVIQFITLGSGGSSGGTAAFEAGADNLILGFTGSRFTRYDFDG
jgi:hypothetical protein